MISIHDTSSISNSIINKNGNNELVELNDEKQNSYLSTSTNNTSLGIVPKAISTSEADMLCTTVENVSHVRFEWTVEDFYPQM